MNYSQTLQYLSDAEKFGIIPGLDSIKRLCAKLGDPQKRLNIIHIAGTNGKGSVGCFLESVLRCAGYKTGRFVSPGVMDELEIIQLCGENISQSDFSQIITLVRSAADEIVKSGFPHPTLFELQTAAAFCFFAQKGCDIALVEVGMGGKEDSTNVIDSSLLSVITPISLEHTKFLGSTIEQIASHKGGIIKKNGCVVSALQTAGAMKVLKDICLRQSARLTVSDPQLISKREYSPLSQSFSYKGLENIKLSLLGTFQMENAALAIDACMILRDKGYKITNGDILKGLAGARWHGRFEVIRGSSPTFIIDGAHNPSGAQKLMETLDKTFAHRRITYIFGTFKDKDYESIAELTAKRAEMIYTIPTKGKRGLSAQELAKTAAKYNPNVKAMLSPQQAVKQCLNSSCDLVLAFGSLSFLKEIKDTINGEYNNGTEIPQDLKA